MPRFYYIPILISANSQTVDVPDTAVKVVAGDDIADRGDKGEDQAETHHANMRPQNVTRNLLNYVRSAKKDEEQQRIDNANLCNYNSYSGLLGIRPFSGLTTS